MTTKEDRKDLLLWISEIYHKRGDTLSEWELKFIANIKGVVQKGWQLSEKQHQKLLDIETDGRR